MARCIFENLTPQQAKVLADWFEGQGEQDCCIWFDNEGVKSPLTDVSRLGEHGDFVTLDNGDVIVYTKTI